MTRDESDRALANAPARAPTDRMLICRACGHQSETAREGDRCPRSDGFLIRRDVSDRHPDDLFLGRALDDDYVLLDVLGAGGFGAVYRALDRTLARQVAVKMLHAHLARSADIRARFDREARAIANLRHPSVVDVYRFGARRPSRPGDPYRLYMVLEFLEGRTLDAVLDARGRVSPPEAIELVEPLLRALEEAHRQGIVHRDLKPSNIMISPSDGRPPVRLFDFGIAKVLDDEHGVDVSRPGVQLGTPRYMSPEQARGDAVGPATDLYSLGIVLYEMLVGWPPFVDESVDAVLGAHVARPVPPMPAEAGVSPALERAVRTALAKRPEERFGSARAMRHALVGALSGREAPRGDPTTRALDETLAHMATVEVGPPPARGLPAASTSALDAWRQHQLVAHRQRALFWQDEAGHPELLDQIYVELALSHFDRPRRMVGRGRSRAVEAQSARRLTLAGLLARTSREGSPGRYAVIGEPGAGKSTIARHLAYTLGTPEASWAQLTSASADRVGDADSPDLRALSARPVPVPIYVSLVDWAESEADLFTFAADGPGLGLEPPGRLTLAENLRALAAMPHGVWILLDGFDELRAADVRRTRDRISTMAARWPCAAIAVFSRPIGYDPIGGFERASIQPLDGPRQAALMSRWLGPIDGPAAAAAITRAPALAEVAGNPLMLSLLAMIWFARTAEGAVAESPLPATRGELFGVALDVLMTRGHHLAQSAAPRISQPSDARRLLGVLSVAMTGRGGEAWRIGVLTDALWLECPPILRASLEGRPWRDAEHFLHEVAQHTGALTPDSRGRWRFMHRSLRERLAAERLCELGPGEISGRIRALGADDARAALGRWGETLGIACALLDADGEGSPVAELRAADPPLAVRLLPELTGLAFEDALGELFAIDPGSCPTDDVATAREFDHVWDGDTLVEMAAKRPDGRRGLWAMVTDARSLDELAFLHYALGHPRLAGQPGAPLTSERFFGRLERWRGAARPTLPLVDVEAGVFRMGSPVDEPARRASEGPQRQVTLTRAFRLGRTPVTRAQYRAFDPQYTGFGSLPEQPVVEVTWWRARLFAAWVGGRLPTEAEWEYACRAGTTTATYVGSLEPLGPANAPELDPIAWYPGNSGVASGGMDSSGWPDKQYDHRRAATRPVGLKAPNAWGLYDMLGNVWEWIEDWWAGDYADAACVDPVGPATGEGRVCRGGSFKSIAQTMRSAFRERGRPGRRGKESGFRVALPPEPSVGER